jgi:hypothetical protein
MQISKKLRIILATISLSAAHPVDLDKRQNGYGLCGIPGLNLQSMTLGSATYYFVVPWDLQGYSAGPYYDLQIMMDTMLQDLVQCGATEEAILSFQTAQIDALSNLPVDNTPLKVGMIGLAINAFNGVFGLFLPVRPFVLHN